MDANSVNQVVDKLAEKIGVAADKLMPLGEETIRQVQARGLMQAGIGAMFLLVPVVLGLLCWRYNKKLDAMKSSDVCPLMATGFVVGGIALIIGAMVAYYGMSEWLAPLPCLLGK